jgi:hypothetical protein
MTVSFIKVVDSCDVASSKQASHMTALLKLLACFTWQGISNVMWACSMLKEPLDTALFGAICSRTMILVDEFRPQVRQ